jgi:hypothetical protein
MYKQQVLSLSRRTHFPEVSMKRRLVGVAVAVLGTVLIGGVGLQSAHAAATVPTEITLPLFGVPLTVGITTGPGGALANVTVNPADSTVATELKPHKVVFQSSDPANPTGDPARVVVKSGHGGQSVSARAGSLKDVSGPGKWSGDVFGDGTASTVAFTVGAAADGSPDITAITTTGAKAVVGTVERSSGDDDEENEMSARVSITFTNTAGDMSRTVKIAVKVSTDEDGDTSAKLSISLGGIKGVAVDAAKAAGPHTWTGVLCDNSPATVAYTVAADGAVSAVVATPATATVKQDGGKIDVRFSDNERVRINVKFEDGLIKISVKEGIRCDSANPTTNVETSTTVSEDNHDGDNHDGGGNNGGGDHKRGGDHDDTTVPPAPPVAAPGA